MSDDRPRHVRPARELRKAQRQLAAGDAAGAAQGLRRVLARGPLPPALVAAARHLLDGPRVALG